MCEFKFSERKWIPPRAAYSYTLGLARLLSEVIVEGQRPFAYPYQDPHWLIATDGSKWPWKFYSENGPLLSATLVSGIYFVHVKF
jgi:hypothetical protein